MEDLAVWVRKEQLDSKFSDPEETALNFRKEQTSIMGKKAMNAETDADKFILLSKEAAEKPNVRTQAIYHSEVAEEATTVAARLYEATNMSPANFAADWINELKDRAMNSEIVHAKAVEKVTNAELYGYDAKAVQDYMWEATEARCDVLAARQKIEELEALLSGAPTTVQSEGGVSEQTPG